MATLLMGYDVEAFAIGEGLARLGDHGFYDALEPETTRIGLEVIKRNHTDLGVPATLFVCGRTLVHNVPALRAARDVPLLDIQQHTYSHVLFKEDRWKGGAFLASTPEALLHELTATSALLKQYLDVDCAGLRTPHGYYLGLSDRPDLLEILQQAGIRFVSSWARNEEGGNPTPFDTQPFWYVDQGYPKILEIPFQFWLDGIWFEQFGPEKGTEFREVLKSGIDEIVERDLVYGACFHDWCMPHYNEPGTGWVRGLLEHALERGVEIMSYTQFYERQVNSLTT